MAGYSAGKDSAGRARRAGGQRSTWRRYVSKAARCLPQDDVEEVVYPFVGPGKTAIDIEHAKAALQALYTQRGFDTVSVVIPPQHIDAGSAAVVQLQVIERRVGRLRVTGAKYFLPSDVRAGAPSVAPGTVPNRQAILHDLTALNTLPDRQVQPSLRAGRHPDTVDVDLEVTDKYPLHGSLELNNRNNADTSALRLAASLTYGNLFQRGDSATISYQVAPENVRDAEVTSASYLFHVPDSKLSLLLSYLHSNSDVTALGSTDVTGRGTSAGFRVLIPLGSTSNFSHSLSAGWDYKKYYELDTFVKTRTFTAAPVTYYPVSATYAADWTGERSTTDRDHRTGIRPARRSAARSAAVRQQGLQRASPAFPLRVPRVTRQQDLPYGAAALGFCHRAADERRAGQQRTDRRRRCRFRAWLSGGGNAGRPGRLPAQTELRSPSVAKYRRRACGHPGASICSAMPVW